MEGLVKDAVLTGEFEDLVLFRLVELTAYAVRHDRPLFPSPLDEPVFFRKYFQPWVKEALEERDGLRAAREESEASLFR